MVSKLYGFSPYPRCGLGGGHVAACSLLLEFRRHHTGRRHHAAPDGRWRHINKGVMVEVECRSLVGDSWHIVPDGDKVADLRAALNASSDAQVPRGALFSFGERLKEDAPLPSPSAEGKLVVHVAPPVETPAWEMGPEWQLPPLAFPDPPTHPPRRKLHSQQQEKQSNMASIYLSAFAMVIAVLASFHVEHHEAPPRTSSKKVATSSTSWLHAHSLITMKTQSPPNQSITTAWPRAPASPPLPLLLFGSRTQSSPQETSNAAWPPPASSTSKESDDESANSSHIARRQWTSRVLAAPLITSVALSLWRPAGRRLAALFVFLAKHGWLPRQRCEAVVRFIEARGVATSGSASCAEGAE